ncbi:hypothetical protein, partial [Actinomadura sp. CNU-125]|uniref:hypothetical protein n=1 Tax=Actinomadura sp. CNU-125 TaxID=1904961 RepID=UPI000A93851A
MADTTPDDQERGRDELEPQPDRPIDRRPSKGGPDVYLNVPELKVEEISLEVENLEAHVALSAQVLDMLRLNVGADVGLGAVKLDIKGVEAQALLEVRLDEVAAIVDRVLTTLDRNPQLLEHIGRGVESIGTGAGRAVGELGSGARSAVEDVGEARAAPSRRSAGAPVARCRTSAGARATSVVDVGEGAGGGVQDV